MLNNIIIRKQLAALNMLFRKNSRFYTTLMKPDALVPGIVAKQEKTYY
jgi:hypothetical protein